MFIDEMNLKYFPNVACENTDDYSDGNADDGFGNPVCGHCTNN